ncbi:MAG: NAD(P)/FAD-dependent oxidoreductase [Flavobacteriaceae bacterium]
MMGKKVVIVGGGIVGLSCAYYLQKEGHQVTLIDKGNFKEGASYVNAGYLTPSHILPLASPAMLEKGIRWMFRSDSPFYIQPRLDLDLWRWGWHFIRSCSSTHVERSIQVIKDINLFSKALYLDLKEGGEFDFHIEKKGLLMAYQTAEVEREETRLMKRALAEDLEVTHLSSEEVTQLQPEAPMQIKGAFWYQCDAHLNPELFMQQLKGFLEKKGVQIIANTPVVEFKQASGTIKEVVLPAKTITADVVVMATGAWSEKLVKPLGIKLPIQAGKGYRINVTNTPKITYPALLLEAKVAVTPMGNYTRFGGTMELSGLNHKLHKKRIEALVQGAMRYYEGLQIPEEAKQAARCGLRPLSPDGLPFIGPHSRCKNFILATGHAMMGWSLGPATGKLVAELISEKKTSLQLSPFHPERLKRF